MFAKDLQRAKDRIFIVIQPGIQSASTRSPLWIVRASTQTTLKLQPVQHLVIHLTQHLNATFGDIAFSWRLDICTSFYHCWHRLNSGKHAAESIDDPFQHSPPWAHKLLRQVRWRYITPIHFTHQWWARYPTQWTPHQRRAETMPYCGPGSPTKLQGYLLPTSYIGDKKAHLHNVK
jgi:hypothetical protein